ncbi:hypothetical protein IHN63_00700 [Deinococcus sp. 6YEL10]|uniref:hypothetical protein n=1 Tax=Deinococcus sp. 6YEL10 TaxID=2745870 RepID=UPI001E533655|nr:hypothetical protein [Deinococcus sp. 6YEL10]MCD0159817.1 hypothetical protein [Deinococcus sp. 6YEL10]
MSLDVSRTSGETPAEQPWYRPATEKHLHNLVVDGTPISTRAAADLLGIGKSAAAVYMRWLREAYLPDTAPARTAPARQDTQPDARSVIDGDPKEHWVKDGYIYTDLGPDYPLYSISQRDFDSLRRDYSTEWGGRALNQADIAYKYNFPSTHAVSRFLRVHGLRHSSLPFSDEQLDEIGVDAAVQETAASRRQKYLLDLREVELKQARKDADRWRALEFNLSTLITAHLSPVLTRQEPVLAPIAPAASPFALVLGLSDIHIGKLTRNSRGERTYDRQIAKRRVLTTTDSLLAEASLFGRPETIVFMIGQDGAHVDNDMLTTTAGTPQAGQTDGSFREIVTDYVETLCAVIDRLVAVSHVELCVVPGNHDRLTTLFIGLLLRQVYRNHSRVTFHQVDAPWLFLNYGDNTLMLTHGDGLKNEASIYRVFMTQAREQGVQLGTHLSIYTGHLHTDKQVDLGGIVHNQIPSITPSDDWHKQHGYVGARQESTAYILDRHHGRRATLFNRVA